MDDVTKGLLKIEVLSYLNKIRPNKINLSELAYQLKLEADMLDNLYWLNRELEKDGLIQKDNRGQYYV